MSELDNQQSSSKSEELLDELSSLDKATEQVVDGEKDFAEAKAQINSLDEPVSIDAASLSLQAAVASQQAAEKSHQATEVSLGLAADQKAKIHELADSNLAWRHNVNSAIKQIEASKNILLTMMIVGIVFSVISVATMGYLYYSINKENAMMKGDVLDIIVTENSLSNKKYELRLDQLYSLIENLPLKINNSSLGNQLPIPVENQDTTFINPVAVREVVSETVTEKVSSPQVVVVDDANVQKQVAKFVLMQKEQNAQIEQLITQLESKINKKIVSSNAKAGTVVHKGLTDAQQKRLNGISWLVRQQGITLKEIQVKLNKQLDAKTTKASSVAVKKVAPSDMDKVMKSLNDLKLQLEVLQEQQLKTQKQVENLKVETSRLSDTPRPYRYQTRN